MRISGLQIPIDSVSATGVKVLEPEVLGRFDSLGGSGAIRVSATHREGKVIAGVSVVSIEESLVSPFDCSYTLGMGETLEDALLNLIISFHESLHFIRKIAPSLYALNIEGEADESPDQVVNMLCRSLIVNPENPMLTLVGARLALLKESFAVFDLGQNTNMLLNGKIHRAVLNHAAALIVDLTAYQVTYQAEGEVRWPFSHFVFGGFQRGVPPWFIKNMHFLEGGYLCLKSMIETTDLSDVLLQKGH